METKPPTIKGCIIFVVISFFLFAVFCNDEKENEPTKTEETKATAQAPKTPHELKTQLEREINSLADGFDNSAYNTTLEALMIELAVFNVWTNLITEGNMSPDSENQELAEKLQKEVVKVQVKEFPLLRKKYCEILSQKGWENDMYFSVSGNKNTILNITAHFFATNKNIKQFQESLISTFQQFRFKEIRYRWYENADYTYYDMAPKADSDLFYVY